MSDAYLGSIILFAGNFAPRGYALCQGQTFSIAQNSALFAILGTTYGGNGTSTFQLPDLRGRVPIGTGQAPGLSSQVLGQSGGTETVTLTANQLPTHTHPLSATNAAADSTNPIGAIPAKGGSYSKGTPSGAAASSGPTGGNQAHSNMQPTLALNYIICVQGLFPSRN